MKYFQLIISLFIVLAIVSCGKSDKEPKKLLSKSEMINVMTEMQLIDATIELNQNDSNKNRNHVYYYYNVFLKKYNIDSTDLKENFKYYSTKPEVMEEIYDSVIIKLSEYQSQNQAVLPK